jgi:hypothetical protein
MMDLPALRFAWWRIGAFRLPANGGPFSLTATAKKVVASDANTLKRVTLELGGNDAGIVLGDVDPKKIAPAIFDGGFQNSGQICLALKPLCT